MSIIIIDGRRMTDKKTVHEYLAKALMFPETYGKNLDALYDLLCEIRKTQIIFTYVREMQENLGRYADGIINTFEAACEKNRNLYVVVEELVDEI